jgi:hypothetical protein
MATVAIPSPISTPKPWDELTFRENKTAFHWPEKEEYGLVEWSAFKSAAKLDKKGKTGSAKPRVTKTGGEGVKFSFTLRIVADNDDAISTAFVVVDKLRPGAGPFYLDAHPWAALHGVRGFMVEDVETPPPTNGEILVIVGCVEINPDAQAGTGKNVKSTPSRETDKQRALAEYEDFVRRTRIANMTVAANERQNRIDAANAAGNPIALRPDKKLEAWIADNGGDVGAVPREQQQPNPPLAVVTGKAG